MHVARKCCNLATVNYNICGDKLTNHFNKLKYKLAIYEFFW